MRWDKWFQGVLVSGALMAGISASASMADGEFTKKDRIIVGGAFLGGVVLYMKEHPPKETPTEENP